jgi:hypothetical protein
MTQAKLAADPQGVAHQELVESSLKPLMEALHRTMSAPTEIVRGPDGRAVGIRRVLPN